MCWMYSTQPPSVAKGVPLDHRMSSRFAEFSSSCSASSGVSVHIAETMRLL